MRRNEILGVCAELRAIILVAFTCAHCIIANDYGFIYVLRAVNMSLLIISVCLSTCAYPQQVDPVFHDAKLRMA